MYHLKEPCIHVIVFIRNRGNISEGTSIQSEYWEWIWIHVVGQDLAMYRKLPPSAFKLTFQINFTLCGWSRDCNRISESFVRSWNPPSPPSTLSLILVFCLFIILNFDPISLLPNLSHCHDSSSLGDSSSRVSGRRWEDNSGRDQRNRDCCRGKVSPQILLFLTNFPPSFSQDFPHSVLLSLIS